MLNKRETHREEARQKGKRHEGAIATLTKEHEAALATVTEEHRLQVKDATSQSKECKTAADRAVTESGQKVAMYPTKSSCCPRLTNGFIRN